MSRFYDVDGFDEANAHYENQHPDDYNQGCEYCDGEGCPECDSDDEDEQ